MPSITLNAWSLELDEKKSLTISQLVNYMPSPSQKLSYIEGFRECQETVPAFTLVELSKMYCSILEDQGVVQMARLHSTRLKEKVEAEIPDLVSCKRQCDIVLAFDQHMGDVIAKAYERDVDSETLQLARAAALVRRDIFKELSELFNDSFPSNCLARSVPASLKALVSMILDGPCSNSENSFDEVSAMTASLLIAQLISFNCVKRRKRNATEDESKPTMRHNREREILLPVYIGLKIHVKMRNRSLIDKMSKMRLSISYVCVMSVSMDAANSVCSCFEQDGVVCPPKLCNNLLQLVHEITLIITLVQLPQKIHFMAQQGSDRGVNVLDEYLVQQRSVRDLPANYTNAQPVVFRSNDTFVPEFIGPIMPPSDDNASSLTKELEWFKNVKSVW